MLTLSFDEVSASWKRELKQYVSPSSYATYTALLDKHILPGFGPERTIGESQVQAFVVSKTAEGLSAATVRHLVLVLKMVMRHGADLGVWDFPRWHIRYPQARGAPLVQLVSGDDCRKLLRYAQQRPSAKSFGICICLTTGIRIGELCALTWDDMDLAAQELHVRKTYSRIYTPELQKHTSLHMGAPKTGTSVRDIPLTKPLCRLAERIRADSPPGTYILSGTDKPVEPRSYRNYYKALLSELEIPQVKFHALRHSFATRCIEASCDYKTVSAILGHSNISTTLNLYVHPGMKQKKDCIDKVVGYISGS